MSYLKFESLHFFIMIPLLFTRNTAEYEMSNELIPNILRHTKSGRTISAELLLSHLSSYKINH